MLLLWSEGTAQGYASPIWMTFRQALQMNGAVRKGETGTTVIYASRFTKSETTDTGGEIKRDIPFLKAYIVFNIAHIDGLPGRFIRPPHGPQHPRGDGRAKLWTLSDHSAVIAIVIAFFAIQILFGRKHLRLPNWLEKREIDGTKLKSGLKKIESVSRWTDKVFRPRMQWATKPPYLTGIAVLIILLCASVPPLELIPFASTIPMAAVGLALLARDGLMACIAVALSTGVAYLVYTALAM